MLSIKFSAKEIATVRLEILQTTESNIFKHSASGNSLTLALKTRITANYLVFESPRGAVVPKGNPL